MNLIAVYGSLKKGFFNHTLLGHSYLVNTGSLKGFKLYSLGSYPCIYPSDDDTDTVLVEIYNVTNKILDELNRMETSARYYPKIVKVKDYNVLVWVYNTKPDTKHIKSGIWKL